MCDLRVRVAAVLLLDGRLVLVRHRKGDRTYHLLPGGGVEAGETLSQALTREITEETGLTVKVGRPLFINDSIDPHGARHVLNITFLAGIIGGSVTDRPADPRVEAIDLVDPSVLTGVDLRPPFAEQLADAVLSGFAGEARYLGALWADEPVP